MLWYIHVMYMYVNVYDMYVHVCIMYVQYLWIHSMKAVLIMRYMISCRMRVKFH
jgi:hypothetical protein